MTAGDAVSVAVSVGVSDWDWLGVADREGEEDCDVDSV